MTTQHPGRWITKPKVERWAYARRIRTDINQSTIEGCQAAIESDFDDVKDLILAQDKEIAELQAKVTELEADKDQILIKAMNEACKADPFWSKPE